VGSKVIVAGGHDGNKRFSSAEYLDLEAEAREMKWTVIQSMKEKRSSVSGVLLDDGVTFFVTGGNNGESRLSSCEQLDTTMMTWRDAPSMATARSAHCTVLYKKKVVVIGGADERNALALCEEYNSLFKTWSPFPPLTQARYSHGACVLDDRIFVIGGIVRGVSSNHVEVFDGVKWSALDLRLSEARYGHACVVWERKVVVLGGDRDFVEVYDETRKRWRSDMIPQMSTAFRHYLSAVSF
jgi:hypothetical protein